MALELPLTILPQTETEASATVIFLHGSGDSGPGMKNWIQQMIPRQFTFPHVRCIFPTAPLRPYTPLEGAQSNVWFDRYCISPSVPEHLETLEPMAEALVELVKKEVESGIPLNRIIIGGFSMGGSMALHLGYRFLPELAGVCVLSGFLNDDSAVYKHLQSKPTPLPRLFMCHGKDDTLVPLEWGKKTFTQLEELGVEGDFHSLWQTEHELTRDELLGFVTFIKETIPKRVVER